MSLTIKPSIRDEALEQLVRLHGWRVVKGKWRNRKHPDAAVVRASYVYEDYIAKN